MLTRRQERRGFGMATMFAMIVPGLVLTVAIAHMFQASGVRRMTGAAFHHYLVGEVLESSIAEASHLMATSDMFPDAAQGATFTTDFVTKMIGDQFSDLPADDREYQSVLDQNGQEMAKVLLAIDLGHHRGHERPHPIALKGLAKAAAEANPGVKVVEMKVFVSPMTFRREYIQARGQWINWGLVRFMAHVEMDTGEGVQPHSLMAIKMYTLRASGKPGDVVEFSDRNLRTLEEHHHGGPHRGGRGGRGGRDRDGDGEPEEQATGNRQPATGNGQ